MKNVVKKVTGLFLAILLITSFSYAKDVNERIIEKSREAVEKAGPHDWEVLAESAKKCIKKDINVEEALAWLDKSIEINPNKENLTLKGDYYVDKKLPQEALKCYLKAAQIVYAENKISTPALGEMQRKIKEALDLRKEGF